MSIYKRIGLVTLAVLFATITASPANNGTEVIFADTGASMTLSGNSGGDFTPFGFWIWCAGAAASNSNGGYQNANACQGSMYFYALDHHANHVVGDVTESPAGIYHMHVQQGTAAELFSGSLNSSFLCTLSNTTPDPKGPGNGVNVTCSFPGLGGGTGSSNDTGAVTNVTGPN